MMWTGIRLLPLKLSIELEDDLRKLGIRYLRFKYTIQLSRHIVEKVEIKRLQGLREIRFL
jgi:hypothetical protein